MGEREKREYVCLRCGNVYSSRAKVPQCPICKSRKRMELEKFLALPKEQQEKLLGKSRDNKKSEDNMKTVESNENVVRSSDNSVKSEEKEEKSEKYEEHQENSVKYDEARKSQREKGKSEGVKRGISIPRSGKVYAILGGLAFAYVMYHFGWFDEVINSLKRLGAFAKSKPKEEESKIESNPILERAKKNLS